MFAATVLAGLALTACGDPEPAGGALPPPSEVTSPSTTDVPLPVTPTEPSTTGDPDVVGSDGPYDADAETRPDLMVVEPSTAAPGQVVQVTYPGGRERGVAYVLERWTGATWSTTHYLTATTDGYGTEPGWQDIGTEGYGWEDIGIAGEGPDGLIIPDNAVSSEYRICTANSLENICAEIAIVEPDATSSGSSDMVLPATWGTREPVADLIGLPLDEFSVAAGERGFGPVRVAWRDGEDQALDADLRLGRINVAVVNRDGAEIVVDARIESDPETGWVEPEATVVGAYEGVEFYPACGDEQLEHEGVVWYQVQEFEYPEIYDRAANGYREQAPESVAVHGFAARVVAPGPGDDIGTLVVWSDGVAYFVSDSGDLHAWLVQEELTYTWVC